MFGRITPMVKNLLIINVGVHLLSWLLKIDVSDMFSFYGFHSPKFEPYQLFTYMFLHANFSHLLFNMIGLIVFGPMLENFWGASRFLQYYLITGIGAGILYAAVNWMEFNGTSRDAEQYIEQPTPEGFYSFLRDHFPEFRASTGLVSLAENFDDKPDSEQLKQITVSQVRDLTALIRDGGMLGASGAIFGLLMAAGLLFPNTQVMLLIPPIPIKIKYMALILGSLAIFGALHKTPGDNVAHFAHLGGMVVGIIIIKIWNRDRTKFY